MSLNPPSADCTTGSILLGRYRLLRNLAAGGMSEVYLAEQLSIGRKAAVKIVRPLCPSVSQDLQNRLRQEARTASRLVHPNIVTIYDFGELTDGSVFLAMEYVDGASLRVFMSTNPLPVSRVLDVIIQCTTALQCAHSRGVVHRDFKPENVMVTQASQRDLVKVLDFGVAKLLENPNDTRPGMLIGTPRYMSPEQCRGESASPASDQYSLGLVFYEMLTGAPVIDAPNAMACLRRHLDWTPPPPSSRVATPEVRALDAVVMRMLAKPRQDRFADLGELLHVLRAVAGLPQVEAQQPGGSAQPELPSADTTIPEPELTHVSLSGNPGLITEDGVDLLRAHGFVASEGAEAELNVVSLTPDSNLEGPRRPAQTIACIAAPLETAVPMPLLSRFHNVMIGPHPVEPEALALALRWMQRPDASGIECLSGGGIQMAEVSSSMRKSAYVDALIQDAEAEGVRRHTVQLLGEVAEELILNAFLHAPVEPDGRRRNAHLSRSSQILLRPGEEASLRWLIGRRFVAVSVRDRFGSLPAELVLTSLTSKTKGPSLQGHAGVGMGLRIVCRAAQHVFFGISSGTWSEVLALLPREPGDRAVSRRSACVLQHPGQPWARVGDRLRVRVAANPGGVCIALDGEINETSALHSVFRHPGTIRLDLGGITRINSVGIRAWLEAFRGAKSPRVILERCSPPMVSQFNLIPSLARDVAIESILAPYLCRRCGRETLELVMTEAIRDGAPPQLTCHRCGIPLEFDAVAEEYFALWRH